MSIFSDIVSPRKRLLEQEKELRQLRAQLQELQALNDSMRAGMRRCVSCEYRIDFKKRQNGEA